MSLCPSTTETLFALGLSEQVVGVTRFCVHPASGVAAVEKVGGTKNPKIERILALSPDLVLMNEEENRREDYEALKSHTRVYVDFPQTVADVPRSLRQLGALTGRKAEAEAFAAKIEAEIESLDAKRPGAPLFSFAYLIWQKPWMGAGPGTYVHDLLVRAGGENVLTGDRYPSFSLEDLCARSPSLVLLSDEPFPFGPRHVPEVQAQLPNARIELVSGEACCWHGVRSLDGLRLARSLLERTRPEPHRV